MHFARAVSRPGSPDIHAFEYRICRVTLIAAGAPATQLEENPAVG